MSFRDTGKEKFKRGGEFGLASDGGRSLSMEYDDVKFIDKDCQLAGKDEYQSNTEGHRQILPRFDLGDHIGVQLGFNSLEDSVLLEDQGPREEPWVSHFSREENGVLALGTVSQNIEFSSTATETCTISRHINVWSEATSSESVQMLLNSVGEDEENLVDGQVKRSNLNESLDGSNSVEVNVVRIECSNTGEDLNQKQVKSTEIDQQGLENRAMEVKDDTQKILTMSESAESNRPEKDNFAYKAKEQACILEKDASKIYKDPKGEILDNEPGQKTATTASLQEGPSDSGVKDFQEMPNPMFEEYNKENTQKCEIEDTKEKDIIAVNLQSVSVSLVDEHNDTNMSSCLTCTSDKAVVSSEDQVTSKSPSNRSSPNKSIKDAIDSSHADDKSALVSDNITDDKSVKHAIDTVAEDETTVKTQALVGPLQGANDKAENRGSNKTSLNEDLGPTQVISDPMEVDKSKFDVEQGIVGTEVDIIPLQGKSKDEIIVEDDDTSVKPNPFQDGDNRIVGQADVKTIRERDHEQGQGISDPMEVDCIYDHKNQDGLEDSHENVLGEIQSNQALLLDKGNEHQGEKYVTEASNQDALPTYNDQKLECEGERVMAGSDGQSLETDIVLEEKTDKQKNVGVETADVCLSGENKVIVSFSLSTDADSEMVKDVGSSAMIGETRSECKITESEVLRSSSIDEPRIMPNLNINDNTQVLKCPVEASISSPVCPNENALSISADNLVQDGTRNSAQDLRKTNLLTAGFSIENDFHNICDTAMKQENESKNTSVDSIVIATEKQTMDGATDSLGRKSSPVLNMEIEGDKHIAEVPSVQDPDEFKFPTEQAMIGTCQEPLRTNGSSVTQEADVSVKSGPIEIKKVVEEVDMPYCSKAEDDLKVETITQADCCSAQNESASVQESRLQESYPVQNYDVNHDESVQKQQIKEGNTSRKNETMKEATDNSEMKKNSPLVLTEKGTGEHSPEASIVHDPKELTLPAENVITSTCRESLQLNDVGTAPSVEKEVEKETRLQIASNVHDDKMVDPASSSDKKHCMPVSNPGDSCRQTIVPLQETMDSEKDKDIAETTEVSLEVGISLERNSRPLPRGDGNVLQAEVPNEIDVEVSTEAKEDFASSGKCPPDLEHDGEKVDRLGTANDLEAKPVSQSDNTDKIEAGTKDVMSVADTEASVDLAVSDQTEKDNGCLKPFQAAQPTEVKNNDSAVLQTGEVQGEACKESAVSIMKSTQKHNTVSSEVKAKSVPSEGKTSQAISVKAMEKKPMSSEKKSVGNPVTNLSVESTRPGSHPSSVSTGQEPKSSSVGPPSSTQPTSCSTVQTLNLPDLNATASPASVLFQQPFSDLQQVQLRAQILVYGSLIQGSLPEEALMSTAFADIGGASQSGTTVSDGSRSLWENAWNTAADRIHQKTFSNTSDVPSHTPCSSTPPAVSGKIVEVTKAPNPVVVSVADSRNAPVTGMRSADLSASRSHSVQARAVGTTNAGRAGSKNNPSALMSPPRPVSLPSPVWGMASTVNEGLQGSNIARSLHIDPHQMSATRHLYQSPQLGHYPSPANSNPWLSPIHFPGPWLTPPQGTLSESGLPFSSFMMPDITQETLNNRRTPTSSSLPHTPLTHVIPHFPGMAVASAGNVTSANADTSKGAVGRQSSSEHKSRKRKKKSMSEDIAQTSGLKSSVAQVTSVATNISKRPPISTSAMSEMPLMTVPSSSNALVAQSITTPSVPSASHYQVISKGEMGQRVIFSEETASRIEQAKLNAEEAASVAASALRHSQGIWSQLAAQKSSGLVSESEAKLASAAVAAAAAASVAKAAAAAAKVASDAAVQAKLMATEALNSDGKADANQSTEVRLLERNKSHSRSLIAAARETAKKRVEAASAATKRAENLDAVVRAAELAAQAVAQAGAVVAMGDPVPLTLNTLLEAGPEAYWKLVTTQQMVAQKDDHLNRETPSQEITNVTSDINIKHLKSRNRRDVFAKEISRNVEGGMKNSSMEALKQLEKGCRLVSDFAVAPVNIASSEKDNIPQKENQVGGTVETSVDAEAVSRDEAAAPESGRNSEAHINAVASKTNEIKEGSFVEVVSDEEGLRGVWFSAKVLSLKNGKAFVRYDELLSDEGPGQLQEWIPLDGENGKPPRIRMAHPMTVMKFEGTRKRRRAAMGGYIWSVGDHVDAWIRDGWWEGVIQEKDEDESKLKVHFPGEGDTSIIKAWNLRPSLLWRDGQWVEWTSLKAEKEGRHEDDLPIEKRQKLDIPDTEGDAKGKEKMQKIPNFEEAKKMQELQAVLSSAKDKFLSGAKNSTDDGSSVGIRVNQSSFQKEGSKVVFGVPKPTKKRKFMDVSKHYVADRTTRNSPDGKSLGKFDKHKVPFFQSQSGLKDTKVQDKKLKRPLIPKHKDLKPGKFQDGQIKTKTEKDKGSFANPTFTRETLGQEAGQSSMPSFGFDGNKGGRRAGIGGHVPTTKSVEASHPSLLKEAESQRPSSSNKLNASATESEQGSKGKQSSASDSSILNVEKATSKQEAIKEKLLEKASLDTVRRSNRRIQPTSRLLEGLQTSPTVMKGFSASHTHDRGGKIQSKPSSSIPKGNIIG